MLFNSWGYLIFVVLAVPLLQLCGRIFGQRTRVAAIGGFSVLFYAMWRWEFCFLILLSALIDFFCSRHIASTDDPSTRRRWLLVSLIVNLGLLVAFKYTYFIYDNISIAGGAAGVDLPALDSLGVRIILPLGISFYTFQTISYTIDVYRRVIQPTARFESFFAYVIFWPQLIAGPILRAYEVIPQLETEHRALSSDVATGTYRIVRGLFKKVVIADTVSAFADAGFALNAASMTAFDVWVATILFGFQIYCDFAGYSDIAIGSARLMGIRFPENFDWPYMATSPREFWKRWHISLSAWIRDYLYLPLTGEKFQTRSTEGIAVAAESANTGRNRALFLTWFIMGLWHGAGWTFAFWGVYHALVIYLYRSLSILRVLPKKASIVGWMLFFPPVMASWVAFRATDLEQMLVMYGKLANPFAYTMAGRAIDGYSYVLAAFLIVAMLGLRGLLWLGDRVSIPRLVTHAVTASSIAIMVASVLTLMREVRQFIYFQF